MADVAAVIAGILGGDYDDDLADIAAAMVRREEDGAVETLWRIDFEGIEITEENVTPNEARIIESTLGVSFYNLRLKASSTVVSSVIAACLMERNKMDAKQAFAELDKHTARALAKCVSEYTVTSPPKDGGSSETSPS